MEKEKVKKQGKKEEKIKKVPSFEFADLTQGEFGLISLGIIVALLGFLSLTPLMAYTFLAPSADIMVGVGVVSIIVGLLLMAKNKHK